MTERPPHRPTRWLGLPLWASLGLHGLVLALLAVVLTQPGPSSEAGPTRADLRVQLMGPTEAEPLPAYEPLEPDPVADEPAEPADTLPDLTRLLPPEQPLAVDELPEDALAEAHMLVPLLPVHEIPLHAVKPRPRTVPAAEPAPPPAPPPAPAAAPRRVRGPLRIVHRPDPRRWYPEAARRRGIEGTALVRITVDAQGLVVEARIRRSSGSSLLDGQALRVSRAYRFSPGAAGPADLPVRFTLR